MQYLNCAGFLITICSKVTATHRRHCMVSQERCGPLKLEVRRSAGAGRYQFKNPDVPQGSNNKYARVITVMCSAINCVSYASLYMVYVQLTPNHRIGW